MKRSGSRLSRVIAVACLVAALAAACGADPTDGADAGSASGSNEPTPASASPTVAPAEKSPIDGQYTMTLTRQDVLAAGLPGSTASEIAGAWRVTFSFEYAQQFVNRGNITSDGYQGGFAVDGNRLTLTDQPSLVFEWRLADKLLTLKLVDSASTDPIDSLIWTAHSWKLIGR